MSKLNELREWLGRHVDRADRLITWASGIFVGVGIFVVTWLQTYTLDGKIDHAYFTQAVWLMRHGHREFVSSRGLHVLADHSAFILYPIAWIFRWGHVGTILQVVQAAGLGLAASYLYRIARGPAGLERLPATALVAAFALYPGVHNLALSGFEAEALALPAGMAAAYYALQQRWWPYAASVAVMLSTKEDYAVVAVGLGLWLILRKETRAGLITAAAGIVYFAFVVAWLLPRFARGDYTQAQRYAQYGDSTGEVVRFMLTHPFGVVADLFTAQNWEFLTVLFVPVLFLAFLAPKFLIPAIPLQVLLLLSNQPTAHDYRHHYIVASATWIFVASAHGLAKIKDSRRVAALLLAAAVFSWAQWSLDSPKEHTWAWRQRDVTDQARLRAYNQIPKDASVAVSVNLLYLFSERKHVYGFPMPFIYYVELKGDHRSLVQRRRDIDYAVVDLSAPWLADVEQEQMLEEWIPKWGFEKVSEEWGIILLKRTERPDNPPLPPLILIED